MIYKVLQKKLNNVIITRRVMKKFFIFLIFVLIIISTVSYIYLNYQANYNTVKKNKIIYFKNIIKKSIWSRFSNSY